jgi:hypothetical protein
MEERGAKVHHALAILRKKLAREIDASHLAGDQRMPATSANKATAAGSCDIFY